MPDISSYNGIDMGDIASINGQDIAAGGAYDPVADSGTYTETVPSTGLVHYGAAKFARPPVLTYSQHWRAEEIVNYASDKDGIYPTVQISTSNFPKIDTSSYTVAGIDADGKLWMHGYITSWVHQSSNAGTFTQVTSLSGATDTGWTDVSAGTDFVLAINGGKLFVVGENGTGQLGTGNTTDVSTLTQIGTDTDWVSVSAGDNHSAAIKGASGNRSLLTTGQNSTGKCGSGDTSGNDTTWIERVAASASEDWTFIEAGYNHTIAILAGKLYVAGYSNMERFGDNSTSYILTFTQSGRTSSGGAFATNWVSGTCSYYKSMIINTSGELWYAGEGGYGTGSGNTTDAKDGYHIKNSGNATAGSFGSFGGSDQFTYIRSARHVTQQGDQVWAAINNNKLYVFGKQAVDPFTSNLTMQYGSPFIHGSSAQLVPQGTIQNSGQTCTAIAVWLISSGVSGVYASFT